MRKMNMDSSGSKDVPYGAFIGTGTKASPPHGAAVTEADPLAKAGDGWNIAGNLLTLNEI
jgi:hypothetical protein